MSDTSEIVSAPPPNDKKKKVGIGCCSVMFVMCIINTIHPPDKTPDPPAVPISASAPSSPVPKPAPEPPQASDSGAYLTDLGAEGHLFGSILEKGGRNKFVFLAKVREDFDEFTKFNVAGDMIGMKDLVSKGRVFAVPSGQVRAKKIDSTWTGLIQVRILSGAYSGELAWTYMEGLLK